MSLSFERHPEGSCIRLTFSTKLASVGILVNDETATANLRNPRQAVAVSWFKKCPDRPTDPRQRLEDLEIDIPTRVFLEVQGQRVEPSRQAAQVMVQARVVQQLA